jgi:WD40 repeat protein
MEIGRYTSLKEIGRGGMGIVFRARSPEGNDVAIKLLQRRDARVSLGRFDRERRLLATLGEAAGFVPLVDVGDSPSGPYLVMPFVGGGTLRDRLKRGPLAPAEVVALGRSLAGSLGRAHALGIVHRDIKPENVLFTADGRPLVTDLGLAKHFRDDAPGSSQSVSLSKTGEFVGTAGYMAPEQARDSKAADARADVFALGAVLYECLASEPAFTGESMIEVFRKVELDERDPLAKVAPATPAGLARVIEGALAHDPARRYEDGDALEHALAGALEEPKGRRLVIVAIASTTAAVALAVALVLVLAGKQRDPPTPAVPASVEKPAAPPANPAPIKAEPPRAAPSFPSICHGFLRSRDGRARLASLLGSYAWKPGRETFAVAISPDGSRGLSGGKSSFYLWDLVTGEQVLAFDSSSGEWTSAVAFLPDGKRALSGGEDHVVKLWDVAKGKLLRSYACEGHVYVVVPLRDGRRALSAGGDRGVRLWDLDSGVTLRTYETRGLTFRVAVAPRERMLAAGGEDGTIRVFDLETGELLRSIPDHRSCISGLAFTTDGKGLFSGAHDHTLRLWDVSTWRQVRVYRGHTAEVQSLLPLPDGRRVFTTSAGGDFLLRLFDVEREEPLRVYPGHRFHCHGGALMPDGKRVLSGSFDGTLRLWDVDGGVELSRRLGGVRAVAVYADGARILSVGDDATARIWDAAEGRLLSTFAGPWSGAGAPAVSPDGARAIAGCDDGTLRIFDAKHEDLPRTLPAHSPSAVLSLTGTKDGKRFASLSSDDTLSLWDAESGAELEKWKMGGTAASGLAFSSDGATLLSGGADRVIRLIDVATGAPRLELPGHSNAISCVALAADGVHAASGDADGEAIVWDLRTSRGTKIAAAHKGAIMSIAFSPSGGRLVTSGMDGKIRLWATGGVELDRIDLGTSGDVASALTVEPKGRTLVAGTGRGVVLRFAIEDERW